MIRSLILSVLFATTPLTLSAQDASYRGALSTQVAALRTAGNPTDLTAADQALQRIAAAHPDAWLPNYYAAHAALVGYYVDNGESCDDCLDRVDAYLTAAEAADGDNSEVLTLRASYYQAMLNEHPMRAPYYGPKASGLLERAVALDPTNPRAASLLGQNLYYTPAMFGGGADKATPHLARAVELFDAEATATERDELLPTWGADRARSMHGQAVAEAK